MTFCFSSFSYSPLFRILPSSAQEGEAKLSLKTNAYTFYTKFSSLLIF